MLDIREAEIEGDQKQVALLKHHYQDVRVGHLDQLFYGKNALTFKLVVSPSAGTFILFPNKEVVQVWEKMEKGFKRAEVCTKMISIGDVMIARLKPPYNSTAPTLMILFSPISPMDQGCIDDMTNTL